MSRAGGSTLVSSAAKKPFPTPSVGASTTRCFILPTTRTGTGIGRTRSKSCASAKICRTTPNEKCCTTTWRGSINCRKRLALTQPDPLRLPPSVYQRVSAFRVGSFFWPRDTYENNFCYLSSLSAQHAPSLRDLVGKTPCSCGRRSSPWLFVKGRDDSTGTSDDHGVESGYL